MFKQVLWRVFNLSSKIRKLSQSVNPTFSVKLTWNLEVWDVLFSFEWNYRLSIQRMNFIFKCVNFFIWPNRIVTIYERSVRLVEKLHLNELKSWCFFCSWECSVFFKSFFFLCFCDCFGESMIWSETFAFSPLWWANLSFVETENFESFSKFNFLHFSENYSSVCKICSTFPTIRLI